MCYEFKGMINISKLIDLTGKRFGKLTVLERVEDHVKPSGQHVPMWRCRCDCGNEIITSGQLLRNGNTKSCGCIRTLDLTNKRFGRLTVIKRSEDHVAPCGSKQIMWHCVCDCGNEIETSTGSLRSGNTKSCGCLQKDIASEKFKKHGLSGTRLYRIWVHIKDRCYNKENDSYINYGARGITVCDEWKNDFESFRDWALENGYSDELSIDRIDVDIGYCPDNCKWSTVYEQSRNKRCNNYFTHNGKTLCLTDWANELGISYSTLYSRLIYKRIPFDVAINM